MTKEEWALVIGGVGTTIVVLDWLGIRPKKLAPEFTLAGSRKGRGQF